MKKKLLCIEDDSDIAEIIMAIMEQEQYEVIIDDGKSMFRILDEHKIGLILMDERLSWTTGRQLCHELKASTKTIDIPIIVMSASLYIADVAKECEAVGYIKKPFDLDHVIEMVRDHFKAG